jgi:DNA-binding winged helix-turn-helix (wHTH) protein/tetratricopeptide (TPR) repeat protein
LGATHQLLRFGLFELNATTGELRNAGKLVKLPPQAVKLLGLLASRAGQSVSRDEIQNQLWGEETYVDFEHGVNKCIKQIRDALGDNADEPHYIETLPRYGYRFLAPVASKSVAPPRPNVVASDSSESSRPQALRSSAPASAVPVTSAVALRFPVIAGKAGTAVEEEPKPDRFVWLRRPYLMWIGVVLVVLSVIGGVLCWRNRKTTALTERDTIVVVDFANSTGDAVFDDTLKTALTVALSQSPFLNVLSDNKVAATLKLMTLPAGTRLTPELAQRLCQRAGSKAYIAGSIASLGNEYVVGLKATNCQTGDTLAQELVTATGKEKVLNALGTGAAKLRAELGESLATVQKFDVPLQDATTSSLEALQAYSRGIIASREKGPDASLPYDQRAVQLDPNFAMGYLGLGGDYFSMSELGRASEYFTKAFQLREHASERERLEIDANYYENVTGELYKAARAYQELTASYPRDAAYYNYLGIVYATLGLYQKAEEVTRQARELAPDRVAMYSNLSAYLVAQRRFDQSRQVIEEAHARKLEDFILHNVLYGLAFLQSDSPAMAEQERWFADKPEFANDGLALAADTRAYAGHLVEAQNLTKRSVDSAIHADSKETGAIVWENAALREAAFGNFTEARQEAAEGLKLAPASQGVLVEAALAYAMTGDAARSSAMAGDLNKRYPLDTQVQLLWLPAIRAQLALTRKDPVAAINILQSAIPPIEYATLPFVTYGAGLYHTYIRGEAYLALEQGTAAAAEFQKILDHSGLVWNCWTGALARLGLARSFALQGDNVKARLAYEDFLHLWNDADPDIPILKQAKSEYTKLR